MTQKAGPYFHLRLEQAPSATVLIVATQRPTLHPIEWHLHSYYRPPGVVCHLTVELDKHWELYRSLEATS